MNDFSFEERTLLIIRGKNRLSFLNNLSTNKVDSLEVGQTIETIFTDINARIIDLAIIGQMEEVAFIIGHQSNHSRLLTHLMQRSSLDSVEITDSSPLNQFIRQNEEHGNENWTVKDGATIVSDGPFTLTVLSKQKSISEFTEGLIESCLEEKRIKALRPGPAELTAKFTPYNIGLSHLVSETKGCYLGQEILARMQSRGKKGKQLILVMGDDLQVGVNGVTSTANNHGLAIITPQD